MLIKIIGEKCNKDVFKRASTITANVKPNVVLKCCPYIQHFKNEDPNKVEVQNLNATKKKFQTS